MRRRSAEISRGRRAAGAARPGLAVWRSALCADFAAVLGLGSRRRTHYAPWGRFVQTTAASQITKRALRADPKPALLTAPQRAQGGQRLPRGSGSDSWPGVVRGRSSALRAGSQKRAPRCAQIKPPTKPSRKGLCGRDAARLCGAEKRRTCGLARSANRHHARCACLSGVNAVNVASCATGPQDRASQGSRSAAKAATVKRCGPPAQAFAAPHGTSNLPQREPSPGSASRAMATREINTSNPLPQRSN